MQPIVSIIIPIYNVEKYIKECVNSVTEQTYVDLDIILVNDGSTDRSAEICNEIQKQDERVKVIHKSNGGLSQARNKGLEFAKGKYVLFLDSDDFLEKKAVEILVEKSEELRLDVIEFNATKFWPNGNKELVHKRRMYLLNQLVMNGIEYYLKSIEYDCFTAAACFKMIRREILEENKLFFKDNRLHEDELWSPQLMLVSKHVCYLDCVLYNYRMREESITLKKERTNNVLNYMQNCIELKEIFDEKVVQNDKKKEMLDYISRQYMAALTIDNFSWYRVRKCIIRSFPYCNAKKIRTKVAALLYFIAPKGYYYSYKLIKKILCGMNTK